MEPIIIIALLCSAALPLAMATQCSTESLPLRVRGEKVTSSSYQCSGAGSQESMDALQSLNSRVDTEIQSVLPRIQEFLAPSPCAGPDWMRVVYLNMANSSHSCPANSGWYEDTLSEKRVCRRSNPTTNKCGEATFDVDDIIGSYTKICGRVIGYKFGTTEAFGASIASNLDAEYVDGVSITHGRNPRNHVWTFAAGLTNPTAAGQERFQCPCDSGMPLNVPFIGNNFFCESGGADPNAELLNSGNALWDGLNCDPNSMCCSLNDPPFFMVTLDNPTCDNIDVRMCASDGNEGTPIELIELYVK